MSAVVSARLCRAGAAAGRAGPAAAVRRSDGARRPPAHAHAGRDPRGRWRALGRQRLRGSFAACVWPRVAPLLARPERDEKEDPRRQHSRRLHPTIPHTHTHTPFAQESDPARTPPWPTSPPSPRVVGARRRRPRPPAAAAANQRPRARHRGRRPRRGALQPREPRAPAAPIADARGGARTRQRGRGVRGRRRQQRRRCGRRERANARRVREPRKPRRQQRRVQHWRRTERHRPQPLARRKVLCLCVCVCVCVC